MAIRALTLCVTVAALGRFASTTIPAEPDPTKQTDADWIDDRWQKTDFGPFLSAAIDTPGDKTVKGIAIKVGPANEGAVCFDTDLMRYSAAWLGGFLRTDPRRYGLMGSLKPAGDIQFSTGARPGWASAARFDDPRPREIGPLPDSWSRYRGLYLSGPRAVLVYNVGGAEVRDSPWLERNEDLLAFTRTIEVGPSKETLTVVLWDGFTAAERLDAGNGARLIVVREPGRRLVRAIGLRGANADLDLGPEGAVVARIAPREHPIRLEIMSWRGPETDLPRFGQWLKEAAPVEPLDGFQRGGPARWQTPVITRGVKSRLNEPFVIDTLTMPYQNPWNALMFASGHDFFANGDLAVCTAHGDVWRVSGLDETLERLAWKRFATGLYQPLGLKVVRDRVHVLGRDQITILHDLNADGEADYYENFNNACISAGGGHSYATCLETDSEGNFYYLKCAENTPHGGALLRVSADGRRLDVVATGFRNPNGLGISPDGLVTAADQQGEWVPETRLDVIRPGGFYGYMPMHKREQRPSDFDPPLCWIPRAIDNSAGGQVWVPEGRWGPLAGQLLHLSYGRCTWMLILRDERNDRAQAAIVPLPGRFLSGAMRARFSPRDGHLYVTGLRGWQTAALRDGCLQRVRYTGRPLYLPVGFAIQPEGIHVVFSDPLDRATAQDLENYHLEQWNYHWTEKYGSLDYSVTDPEKEGRDPVSIQSVRLHEDQRTVFLAVPGLQPVMQFRLQYHLAAADTRRLRGDLYGTINRINDHGAAAAPQPENLPSEFAHQAREPDRCGSCVAQICNLLYRRFVTCEKIRYGPGPLRACGRSADCKSAIQQVANLRYEPPVQLVYGEAAPEAPASPWPRHVIDQSARGADGVRLADVNNDGHQDIVTGWEEGGVVRLYLQPPRDRLREPWPSVTVGKVGAPEDAVLVDLDRDGALDVVSSCEGKVRTVYAHWNPNDPERLMDPAAWRTEPIPATAGRQMWMFALPVVTGSGTATLLVGSKGQNGSVTVFVPPAPSRSGSSALPKWQRRPAAAVHTNPLRATARNLGAWKSSPVRPAGWIMSLETHDIDGDGDPDVVGSDRKGPRAGVFWLENRTGSEWREHPIGAQGEEVMFLDLGDLDGDGKAEVVAAVKPRQVAIFGPPSGSGGLWARRSIELAGLGGHLKAVRVGDINLDGRPDLVVSCEGADRPGSGVLWYEAVAPNHTRWLPRDISGPAGVKFDRLELVDLDQDGDLDVITCEEQENLGVIWYENPARAALRESR